MARPKKNPDTIQSLEEQIQSKLKTIDNLKHEIKNLQIEIKQLEQQKAVLVMNQLEEKAKEKNIPLEDLIKSI